MKPVTALLIILCLTAACTPFDTSIPEAMPTTASLAPTRTPPPADTATPSPMPSNIPTPTATEAQGTGPYPSAIPIPPLTRQQILEVGNCNIENLAATRYPEGIDEYYLAAAFLPESNCDWAVLAYAYATRNHGDVPHPAGLEAVKRAVSGNYGYALATPLYYSYLGTVHLVKNVFAAPKEITKVDIAYDWAGLGDPSSVKFALTIDRANSDPVARSRSGPRPKNVHIPKEVIQDLSQGLGDLLPIDSWIQIMPCTDNYLNWSVTLYFSEGSRLDLETDSNVFGMGGPWETEIDGQVYIQYSSDFAMKWYDLVQALGLQLGSPAGMFCSWDPVFEQAFSMHLPATATPTSDATMDAMLTELVATLTAESTQETMQTPTP